MRYQTDPGSPPFVLLAIVLARILPRRLGYWVARKVSKRMSQRRSQMFRTLRANLAHVVGSAIGDGDLDALAESALYHAGCTYVDMFRATVDDYRSGCVQVRVDPKEWALARQATLDERGTVVVGAHMSNFDLAAQWLAARGIEMQALSLTRPSSGTRVINWLRRRRGIVVTPIDVRSLRMALTRLRRGGVVLTGVDRPVSEDDEPILFFGAPARLPVGHVRLAMQTGSRVLVACCVQEPDGQYGVRFSAPLEMERTGDRVKDIGHNCRRVLAILEEMIRQAPDQWLMFAPVWPEDDAG
ncbi:MAG TPA: hypothetical protein VMX14_07610 [Anaerolineae bacterium]|nr:hypothetical protein [Anaerolineae bacterium]